MVAKLWHHIGLVPVIEHKESLFRKYINNETFGT